MRDQADRLRAIVDNLKEKNQQSQKDKTTKTAKVITVTSGKGGVGKTNVTVNLAIELRRLGLRVVMLDMDFGLANIDVLFGLVPKYNLFDVIEHNKSILEVLTDGPEGIKFLAGGSGIEELAQLSREKFNKLLTNISVLDSLYDIILIDTGAGISMNVINFVMSADEVLLVTTPEPTAITDAYALVKMVSNRDKRKIIKVIINKADDEVEAIDIMDKLASVSEQFLSLKLNKIGYILNDDNVIKAVKTQQPFTIKYPKSHAAKQIRAIAQKISDIDINANSVEHQGLKGFLNKFLGVFGEK